MFWVLENANKIFFLWPKPVTQNLEQKGKITILFLDSVSVKVLPAHTVLLGMKILTI